LNHSIDSGFDSDERAMFFRSSWFNARRTIVFVQCLQNQIEGFQSIHIHPKISLWILVWRHLQFDILPHSIDYNLSFQILWFLLQTFLLETRVETKESQVEASENSALPLLTGLRIRSRRVSQHWSDPVSFPSIWWFSPSSGMLFLWIRMPYSSNTLPQKCWFPFLICFLFDRLAICHTDISRIIEMNGS
jgi:hypothetical protein